MNCSRILAAIWRRDFKPSLFRAYVQCQFHLTRYTIRVDTCSCSVQAAAQSSVSHTQALFCACKPLGDSSAPQQVCVPCTYVFKRTDLLDARTKTPVKKDNWRRQLIITKRRVVNLCRRWASCLRMTPFVWTLDPSHNC